MMGAEDAKNKSELAEYHFSGSGEYVPMTVKAASYEEALKKWEKERTKVEPTQNINK